MNPRTIAKSPYVSCIKCGRVVNLGYINIEKALSIISNSFGYTVKSYTCFNCGDCNIRHIPRNEFIKVYEEWVQEIQSELENG